MKTILQDISNSMINRYSDRYKQLGYNVKTLGWGNETQQQFRFSQTLTNDVFAKEKTILDIGCGFGDYYTLLKENNIPFKSYIGYDINPDLVQEAKMRNQKELDCHFEEINILESDKIEPVADIGLMLGVLNLNLKEQFENYTYSKKIIHNAFSLVKDCLIVDFLSDQITENYPKEEFVFYHNPSKMLEFALSLSSNVILNHNYAPIPQKEFMLTIYK